MTPAPTATPIADPREGHRLAAMWPEPKPKPKREPKPKPVPAPVVDVRALDVRPILWGEYATTNMRP